MRNQNGVLFLAQGEEAKCSVHMQLGLVRKAQNVMHIEIYISCELLNIYSV